MTNSLICFENMAWESPAEGALQKIYTDGKTRLRLLRFKDNFVEAEWCLSGHVGFVLEGEMTIDFNGKIKFFKKGDGLWINQGGDFKHKVIIEKGKNVELILFESIL